MDSPVEPWKAGSAAPGWFPGRWSIRHILAWSRCGYGTSWDAAPRVNGIAAGEAEPVVLKLSITLDRAGRVPLDRKPRCRGEALAALGEVSHGGVLEWPERPFRCVIRDVFGVDRFLHVWVSLTDACVRSSSICSIFSCDRFRRLARGKDRLDADSGQARGSRSGWISPPPKTRISSAPRSLSRSMTRLRYSAPVPVMTLRPIASTCSWIAVFTISSGCGGCRCR